MAKFQVPQFIETETKLIGPFTLKQFLWIGAGSALLFILYVLVKGIWFFILAVPIAAFSIALAFVKINGVSLVNYILYALTYLVTPKRYLYTKEEQSAITVPGLDSELPQGPPPPKLPPGLKP